MKNEKSNAKRFIIAFNEIDTAIKSQNNLKRSMNFPDVLRQASLNNYIVRKYEDVLIDYSRLRNSIVHQSNDDIIIAEPHADVVEKIEKIAKLLTTPPRAIDVVCRKNVLTVNFDVKIKNVISLMARTGFSNIPVYKDGILLGVANGQKIIDEIGRFMQLETKVLLDDFVERTLIEDILLDPKQATFYCVSEMDVTIDQILELFQKNSKLLVIIISKTGSFNEAPLGIVTRGDVVEITKMLEDF